MSSIDSAAIRIITEFIPKRKQKNIELLHAINKKYPCANPRGPVSNLDCPEDDPLCNCPCADLRPYSSVIISVTELVGLVNFFNSSDAGQIFRQLEEFPNSWAIYKSRHSEYDPINDFENAAPIYEIVNFFENEKDAKLALEQNIAGTSGGAGVTYDEPKNSYLNTLYEKTKE